MERLQNIVGKYNAKIVMISDLSNLFLDKNIPHEDAIRVFNQVVSYLQSFARRNQVILIVTCPTHSIQRNNFRNSCLKKTTSSKANVVVSLWQTLFDREFVLEKHPYLMLGTAEYPSDNLTLTEFL